MLPVLSVKESIHFAPTTPLIFLSITMVALSTVVLASAPVKFPVTAIRLAAISGSLAIGMSAMAITPTRISRIVQTVVKTGLLINGVAMENNIDLLKVGFSISKP